MIPLIGVFSAESPVIIKVTETDSRAWSDRLGVSNKYLRCVESAGGLAVALSPHNLATIPELVARLDGLVLCGGPDLNPEIYGQTPHPATDPYPIEIDRFELALQHEALKQRLPLLAICRGMQMLNVARGGTLIQHVDDLTSLQHRPLKKGEAGPFHPISIEGDSLLSQALGSTQAKVNSFHHQALDQLGEGLSVTARAHDGVVEAVEDPSLPFVVAVQWHAEAYQDVDQPENPAQAKLFELLVSAASTRG